MIKIYVGVYFHVDLVHIVWFRALCCPLEWGVQSVTQ
jgi:hypothetical protein